MNGTGQTNPDPVYGTMGVPSATNTPGTRVLGALCWTDANGNFWLYGGVDYNSSPFSDLWEYNVATNEWTWMNGSDTITTPVYGTRGVTSAYNTPGPRWECTSSWVDIFGNLWFFGGLGEFVANNDLW